MVTFYLETSYYLQTKNPSLPWTAYMFPQSHYGHDPEAGPFPTMCDRAATVVINMEISLCNRALP